MSDMSIDNEGSPRVIEGLYHDWKTIKTRKMLQLIIEVPLEEQERVLRMLGPPMPDREVRVAVAILSEEALAPISDAGKRAVTQCVMLCKEPKFQHWLLDHPVFGDPNAKIEERSAIEAVYQYCEIKSRSELSTNQKARTLWGHIMTEFEMISGRLAEIRR